MLVTVVDRGKSRAYFFALRTVEIADACPVCGGPRGKPELRPFCEDGEFYAVHCWQNPCGHLDTYAAVIDEAETRPASP